KMNKTARAAGRLDAPIVVRLARRGGVLLTDRLCECSEFAAGSRDCTTERDCRTHGPGRQPLAHSASNAYRELVVVSPWRRRWHAVRCLAHETTHRRQPS